MLAIYPSHISCDIEAYDECSRLFSLAIIRLLSRTIKTEIILNNRNQSAAVGCGRWKQPSNNAFLATSTKLWEREERAMRRIYNRRLKFSPTIADCRWMLNNALNENVTEWASSSPSQDASDCTVVSNKSVVAKMDKIGAKICQIISTKIDYSKKICRTNAATGRIQNSGAVFVKLS